jgi:spore coat polysaccharide biosynthesis predicted glycosyltransferase SpsG
MKPFAEIRVVFRAAAGPRRGFGHMVRCLSLARAMGVRPLMSVRGGAPIRETALALGADVLIGNGTRVLLDVEPHVVVIDDPIASDAKRWMKAARRVGALVVTVHDLGIGARGADLVIDGSVTRQAARKSGRRALIGSQFAVLDPRIASTRRQPEISSRVLIALGGGPHATLAEAVASAIVASDPYTEVRIAGGFLGRPRAVHPRIKWVRPRGLAPELAQAKVAIVGGGVSLYEAAALGVPTIGVPVVKAQVPTVLAFARRGAALGVPFAAPPQTAATKALALLNDREQQDELSRRSRALVDGRGAWRAAAAVIALAREPRG